MNKNDKHIYSTLQYLHQQNKVIRIKEYMVQELCVNTFAMEALINHMEFDLKYITTREDQKFAELTDAGKAFFKKLD